MNDRYFTTSLHCFPEGLARFRVASWGFTAQSGSPALLHLVDGARPASAAGPVSINRQAPPCSRAVPRSR